MPSADSAVEELSVPKVSFGLNLDVYADLILSDRGPRAIRVRETAGPKPRSVVFFATHPDVREALTLEALFSVSHYSRLFAAIAPRRAGLLMRPPSALRRQRYAILAAAAAATPWGFAGGSDAIDELSRNVVEALVGSLRRREVPAFDIVGEYGFLAPYLIARQVIGMPGPAGWRLIEWVAARLQGRRFTSETTPCLSQFVWSELVFSQLFADFENRAWFAKLAARFCLRWMMAHIRARTDRPWAPEPGSLLAALTSSAVREQFKTVSDQRYAEHVAYLMLELMGTAQIVPGLAFSGVISRWAIAGDIAQPLGGFNRATAQPFINEQLRLAPPMKFLLRNATKRCAIGGVAIEPGEYVCALTAAAGRDANAIPDPGAVVLDRPEDVYVHFGPNDGPHHCFGRWIAHSMLTAMFAGLQTLPGLHAAQPLQPRGNPVGGLMVHFNATTAP